MFEWYWMVLYVFWWNMMSFWWLELKCFWLTQDVKRWILDVWMLRGLGGHPQIDPSLDTSLQAIERGDKLEAKAKEDAERMTQRLEQLGPGGSPEIDWLFTMFTRFLARIPSWAKKKKTFADWIYIGTFMYIFMCLHTLYTTYYYLIDWGLSSAGKPIKQYFMSWENWTILVQQ